MAEAGFYWCGTMQENDAAACFLCGKQLDGWEPTDNPWSEHKKHSPQCAFVKLSRAEDDLTVSTFLTSMTKILNYGKKPQISEIQLKLELKVVFV